MTNFEQIVCALLRGERATWQYGGDASAATAFVSLARYHGVLPLLHQRLHQSAGAEAWPIEIVSACRDQAKFEAMMELARRWELPRVLDAFADAGIKPLLLKGAALAHTHYSDPGTRPRGDTDLLVPLSQKLRTDEVLRNLGYTRGDGITGEFVSYQSTWSRQDRFGVTHHLDAHWRINNSQILARLLSYEELEARSTTIAALCPHAYSLAPTHAALLACMHRAGHKNAPYYVDGVAHLGGDRLIWLYDIHLLLSAMSDSDVDEFAELASTKCAKAICFDALELCVECFKTPIASRLLKTLGTPGRAEPSALFLCAGPARQMLGDFVAIDKMTDRVQWLGELAFPSREYMRQKYPDAEISWLPVLYLRRGMRGLWRLAFPRNPRQVH